jgi:hypothetical protein
MKVDGRLEHAQLPDRTRPPIIIPSLHRITRPIVGDGHKKLHHAGDKHISGSFDKIFICLKDDEQFEKLYANA